MNNLPEALNTEETLRFLSAKDGVSSTEYLFTDVVISCISNLCDTVKTDKNGNVIGYIYSPVQNAKTVLLEAHMDRIGLMVTGITDNGSLSFTSVGGVDERIIPYSEVVVCGKEKLNGVVYPEGSDEKSEIDNLRIYTGHSKDEIDELVSVGDVILLSSEFINLCGRTVSGAAFDNRAGIVSVLQAISSIKKDSLEYNICVMFSVEEELGLHGAYTGDFDIFPDAAIVVDVTHGETKDTKGNENVFSLGSGAVICRGPSLHFDYTKQLISICRENNIPYDIETAAGSSGTTAWAFQTTGKGIPSMLVSIPLKYMHTNLETLDISDIEAVSRLLSYAVEGGLKL